jgi:hypothetical protein
MKLALQHTLYPAVAGDCLVPRRLEGTRQLMKNWIVLFLVAVATPAMAGPDMTTASPIEFEYAPRDNPQHPASTA